MPTSASTLKFFRQTHLYIGIFIAPAILFFAFTGALQTFSLHESKGRADYQPPHWIMVLAQIHKNQNDIIRSAPPKSPKPAGPSVSATPGQPLTAPKPPAGPPPPPQKSHLPLKIFFLLVSIGLFTSTLTGIYMAYKYNRSKLVVSGLLLAGIIIPLLLLPF